jgi:hypothetical protein
MKDTEGEDGPNDFDRPHTVCCIRRCPVRGRLEVWIRRMAVMQEQAALPPSGLATGYIAMRLHDRERLAGAGAVGAVGPAMLTRRIAAVQPSDVIAPKAAMMGPRADGSGASTRRPAVLSGGTARPRGPDVIDRPTSRTAVVCTSRFRTGACEASTDDHFFHRRSPRLRGDTRARVSDYSPSVLRRGRLAALSSGHAASARVRRSRGFDLARQPALCNRGRPRTSAR